MSSLLERDIRTIFHAYRDFEKRRANDSREQLRTRKTFTIDAVYIIKELLEQMRCKTTEKRELFVPKKELYAFDNLVLVDRVGSELIAIVGAVKDKPRLVYYECYPIKTDRGFCYFCKPVDITRLIKAPGKKTDFAVGYIAVIIKDHAIRRMMERKGVTSYDNALGQILRMVFKGTKDEAAVTLAMSDRDAAENKRLLATEISYTFEGKLVGTRVSAVENLDKRIIIINTYLSQSMIDNSNEQAKS